MRNSDYLDTSNSCITYSPIAFKTPGIRDAFLVNNQELLYAYFQLEKPDYYVFGKFYNKGDKVLYNGKILTVDIDGYYKPKN